MDRLGLRRFLPFWPYLAAAFAVAVVFHQVLWHPDQMLYSPHSDILEQHYPFRRLLAQGIREQSRLPLWNPTAFGGMPLVGDPQAGLFYPPNWLFALVSPERGAHWFGPFIALHVLVGGWGMIWWLRGHGFSPMAQFVGALTFMFTGKWFFHIITPGHVIFLPLVYLPWQCGLMDGLWQQPSTRRVAWLAFITAFAITGCHPQMLFYAYQALVGYALVVGISHWRQARLALGGLAAAGALAVLLSAIHLIPILDGMNAFLRGSGLSYQDAAKLSLRPADFITFLLPSLAGKGMWEDTSYVGVAVVALAGFGVWLRRKPLVEWYWLLTVVICLWFSMGEFGGLHKLLYDHVPGFRLFRIPSRGMLILGLPLGYLAAAGYAYMLETKSWDWPRMAAHLWAFLLLIAGAVLLLRHGGSAFMPALALAVPFIVLRPYNRRWHGLIVAFAVTALFVDQARFAIPKVQVKPLSEALGDLTLAESLRAPWGQHRVLALNYQKPGSHTSLPFSHTSWLLLENTRGFNPLIPEATFYYLRQGAAGESTMDPTAFGKTVIMEFPIKSRPHLDLFNIRWICSDTPLDVSHLRLHQTRENLEVYHFSMSSGGLVTLPKTYVYENTSYFPRAALVRRARGVADRAEALAAIAQLDPRKEVLIEGAASFPEFSGAFQAIAVEHHGDEINLNVDAGLGGYLVLSEVWYPGWTAFDNGEPVLPMKANGIFQALKLEPGAHEIRLRYRPRAYLAGKWLSMVALLGLAIMIWRRPRPSPAGLAPAPSGTLANPNADMGKTTSTPPPKLPPAPMGTN